MTVIAPVYSTNADLVRSGYEALATGDFAAFNDLLAPDVVWHVGGRNPISGDKLGIEATLEYFGELGARTEGSFRIELKRVFADDALAVGVHHETARRGARALDSDVVVVFHTKDGRVDEAWVHYFDQTVVDAFFA